MATSEEGDLGAFRSAYLGAGGLSPEAILRASISALPDALVSRAAALSYRVTDDATREGLQCGLRLRLGDSDQAVRLALALKMIGASSESDRDKARLFVGLATFFPDPLPDVLVDEAQAFVEHLEDDVVRTQALSALTPHLPVSMKDSALAKIHDVRRLPHYAVGLDNLLAEGYGDLAILPGFGKFEVDLHGLVENLSHEDQTALFTEALDHVEARLSGAPGSSEREAADVRSMRAPHERVVNTGFAATRLPGDGFDPSTPLIPGLEYLYWLEIGPPLAISIEETPTPLPLELLPSEARLHVALFGFDGELELDAEGDVGEIELTRDGLARVVRQPIGDSSKVPISDRLATRLFFPVRAPDREGHFRLRCNIYCQNVLVQSRLVTARIKAMPELETGAMRSVVDYTLTESLHLPNVAGLRPHRFSLMINDSDRDTHTFRFFGVNGAKPVKRDVSLSAGTVTDWIDDGRGRLRRATWGDTGEWDKSKKFQYELVTTPLRKLDLGARASALKQLTSDLARLAVGGYRMYHELSRALCISGDAALEQLVRGPGAAQIAIRMSDRLVFPAAMIYDYHWDTNAFPIDTTEYTLCPVFHEAMLGAATLEECACFAGGCPVKAKGDALSADPGSTLADLGPSICPSGFWGFRHALGFPLTLKDASEGKADGEEKTDGKGPVDAPGFIFFQDMPHVESGISTDPELMRFSAHEKTLKQLAPGIDWRAASRTRAAVLKMLKSAHSQIIYFYCHGGLLGSRTPFISVGHAEPPITPDNIGGVHWTDPNPLVFINGCHTTALTPEKALDFVSTFVDAKAAGVVGTEITISESLACAFAEECLSRFLVPDATSGETRTIGESVRGARLALLKNGNPLGLVYIPFAVESLRLKKAA
jgi:hypothetical protein